MKAITLDEICKAVGGKRITPSPGNPGEGGGEGIQSSQVFVEGPHPNPLPDYRERGQDFISCVSTDSRRMTPGCLFIALHGENFDGHNFLSIAAASGAAAAIVDRLQPTQVNLPLILVDNTRRALGRLGAFVRRQLTCPVVAVVGSNGKTSTKHLIDAALRNTLSGTISPKSFNNEIGVPLSIFACQESHDYLVLEVGTNHHGEIANLAAIARPDIAVITNCAAEHLEGLTNLNGVRHENAMILSGLQPGGLLIVNGDDPELLCAVASHTGPRVTFGFSPENDLWAGDVQCTAGGTTFRLCGKQLVLVPLLGRHSAANALAAIAVAGKLDVPFDRIISGLATATGPDMRLQLKQIRGVTILNDAYNANPASMRAALETLSCLPATGRRIAVLGDMRELGDWSEQLHREIGIEAARSKLDALVCVGSAAAWIAESAVSAGMNATSVSRYVDAGSAASIASWVCDGDLVLLKGSRAIGLERIAKAIEVEQAIVRKAG
jgi:UDP-N-acetylmuramoyl-tripeptide--D-alanyl-D-alanine ligase